DRLALAVGEDGAVGALGDLALPRLVAVELRGHDPFATSYRQEFITESDQPAGRHAEIQTHAVGADVLHLDHAPLARAEALGDRAHRGGGHVADHQPHRLVDHAIDFLDHRLGI